MHCLWAWAEGPRIYPRSCHWGFFLKHPTSPCAWGRLSQNIPGGKGGRCVGVTTLSPSCAECLEI